MPLGDEVVKLDDGVYALPVDDTDVMTTKELKNFLRESGGWETFLKGIAECEKSIGKR